MPRAIFAAARDYPGGITVDDHCHSDGQFVHAISGVMEIRAAQRLWLIPPRRALWIPPRLPHALRARGKVSLRTLYIHPDQATARLGNLPTSFIVPPLLCELILRMLDPAVNQSPQRQGHLCSVLIDELSVLSPDNLSLAMPSDQRLARACADILERPGDEHRIDELARLCGASVRTLARLADNELGCPLSTWRQHARVLASIPMLISQKSIIQISQGLGYETPSAFSAMFKKIIGTTPSAYRHAHHTAPSTGPNDNNFVSKNY